MGSSLRCGLFSLHNVHSYYEVIFIKTFFYFENIIKVRETLRSLNRFGKSNLIVKIKLFILFLFSHKKNLCDNIKQNFLDIYITSNVILKEYYSMRIRRKT